MSRWRRVCYLRQFCQEVNLCFINVLQNSAIWFNHLMQRQLHTIFALTAVIWVICQSVNYSILKGFRKKTVIIQIGVGVGEEHFWSLNSDIHSQLTQTYWRFRKPVRKVGVDVTVFLWKGLVCSSASVTMEIGRWGWSDAPTGQGSSPLSEVSQQLLHFLKL